MQLWVVFIFRLGGLHLPLEPARQSIEYNDWLINWERLRSANFVLEYYYVSKASWITLRIRKPRFGKEKDGVD